MAFPFRLLMTGLAPAAWNMGLDEAILHQVAAGAVLPTLRIYGWQPPAISIGYFQGLEEEVDREACRKAGVDIVRRITGGGAVFHHHEVTYSIVLPLDHPLARPNIVDSYRLLCGGIVAGLAQLGIEATFAPINDILAGGRKISGNAQTRKQRCILQHGTILLDVDVDLMFSLLKVPQEKARGKLIEDIKARVTSVRHCIGAEQAEFDTVARAMVHGFAESLDLELHEAAPAEAELLIAGRLAAEKFASPEWNDRR
ncbi:MAG: biotin/lipoate A/B protein ligase family protein [Spirochaetales bacterium]|nr:biotin/lipoate A/B protein ligase family protein [Spirochaetales bacterium]